jgi:hypothetical protein
VNQEKVAEQTLLLREMFTHISELRDRCEMLMADGHGLQVYNQIHSLRSLVGQIASAAERYRRTS